MRFDTKGALFFVLLYGLAPNPLSAQRNTPERESSDGSRVADEGTGHRKGRIAHRLLSRHDGLSVVTVALKSQGHLGSKPDCSHLVHAVYDRADLPYSYVGSSDLYTGSSEFQRVMHPQPGDLVVWPGHVGIVTDPARHLFFSALRSGPGIDSYTAPYWRERGRARFYRYIKVNAGPRAGPFKHRADRQ
jgi:cell wall-associated NlpC family hydrolase